MGDKQNHPFQLSFNASLKVDFQGSRVTSDGGLIVVRELDERLGLGDLIAQHLTDSRREKNTQLPLADLLRQSIYSRMAGYQDVDDAERLSQDPTFRLIGSEKIWARRAALTSRSGAALVCRHGAADRGAASASGAGKGCGSREIGRRGGRGRKGVGGVRRKGRSCWPQGPREMQDHPLGTAGQAFRRKG